MLRMGQRSMLWGRGVSAHLRRIRFWSAVSWAFLLVALNSPAWAQAQVGSVVEVHGQAEIHRAGGVLPARVGVAVMLHDELATSARSSLVLVLSDQTKVSLGELSKLQVDEHLVGTGGARSSTILNLLAGSVRSLVSSVVGRAFNYQIKTSNSVIAVRGTDFEVEFVQGKARLGFGGCGVYTEVRVFSGVVEVENPAQPASKMEVKGGFATTIPCELPPLDPGPLGLAAHGVVTGAVNALPAPACPVCVMPVRPR
jgi:FecR protein